MLLLGRRGWRVQGERKQEVDQHGRLRIDADDTVTDVPSRREVLGSLFALAIFPPLQRSRVASPRAFGIRGLVDDGTHRCLLHGISRTTYPQLKANITRTPTVFLNESLLRRYMELVR